MRYNTVEYVNYDWIKKYVMSKNETRTMLFTFNFYRLLNAGTNQLCVTTHSNIFNRIVSIIGERIITKNPHGANSL
jgi:hypothetical protein